MSAKLNDKDMPFYQSQISVLYWCGELRQMMKVKIIWQGNAISCMKQVVWEIKLFIVYAQEN
jgi:hypothetical protein